MEEYEMERAAYYKEISSFDYNDPRYNFARGREDIFEVPVSSDGRIELPKFLANFMEVTGKSEKVIISGVGRSFNIQSEQTNDEVSVAIEKWLNDLAKQGIYDPLELLPR